MWTTIALSAWMILAALLLLLGKAASLVDDFECKARECFQPSGGLRHSSAQADIAVPPAS